MSANDNFSLNDDEELSLHDDASLDGSAPASNKGDAPAKPPQIITTNTLSNIKLPVLQKDDYDTWAMEMEHYLEYIDNEVWKVIQNGNSKKRVTKGKDGVYIVLSSSTTQDEQFADRKKRKARTLLKAKSEMEKRGVARAFDKRKVECFNCHNTGHFARECKFKGSKEGGRQEAGRGQDFKPVRTEKEALMTIDEVMGARPVATMFINDDIYPYTSVEQASYKPAGLTPNRGIKQINSLPDCTRNNIRPNLSTASNTIKTGRVNANTGHGNVSSVSSAGTQFKSGASRFNTGKQHDHPLKHMEHRGIFDSGCSGHMTGNRAHLEDYQELSKVGSVTFGGSKGSISGKGTIRLGNLVFDDVAFVKELGHFNLFSISQICDKKLNVLFTEKECFVVSSDFKMPDENQVLLKVPRQHNMYTFDMKNVDSSQGYTCLLAKASSNEAKLWHRRLGHLNFKNLNKLVKDNLVRGLPSKSFKNDHTCVACQKGKQHKASCKAKIDRYVTHPLHTLHMDLFGPTSVRSINHASYCLVITDDCSRFCWVFFLAKKDETSGILKTFIRQIENQLNQKVKIIRSDNGTEFKNRVMLEFCGEKGIKQEFSNARTPQQNGVAERMNRTLIEAARSMLADSHLPTTFWAEAVNTACYTFNRVRVTKPQNKTPYELFLLGKFDEKSDEGFLVGYSVNSSKEALNIDVQIEDAARKLMVIISDFNNLPDDVDVPTNPTHMDSQWSSSMSNPWRSKYTMFRESEALEDGSWVEAMQEELLQFKLQQVWVLVDLPNGAKVIGTKWVYRKHEGMTRGVVVRNKARLVAQGHRQEEGIDYDEVFAPVEELKLSGLQVKQNKEGIFISQDKYVAEILKKILTCECQSLLHSQGDKLPLTKVTPKTSHLNAVKRIFKYLKGKPNLGLWYPRESPLDLEAFSDSDYGGSNLDRKSTTGGCQFLGQRLISWQCKKQTIVATSTTEAEYVAAANCCGQVLWVQNQLLDYGFNFMNTKIHIVRKPICIVKNYSLAFLRPNHIEIRHTSSGICYEKEVYKWFAEIVDFLRGSNLRYALTANPTIYDSLVKQFWQSAIASTKEDGFFEISATIDNIRYTITEASIRESLQLDDATGITMLPNDDLFQGMGQIGYPTDGTFTFWKSFFTPQWRYLVHHLLHCISSKSGGWDQFGSNMYCLIFYPYCAEDEEPGFKGGGKSVDPKILQYQGLSVLLVKIRKREGKAFYVSEETPKEDKGTDLYKKKIAYQSNKIGILKKRREPLSTDSIWSEIGQQKIVSWRYYDTSRVHCLNLESMDVYLLSDRKYLLPAETSAVRFERLKIDYFEDRVQDKPLKTTLKQSTKKREVLGMKLKLGVD
ncbi:putative ribonuclease H-like domain-containing protein [Tanacetum coccineum]|uniref:Ribonuclease H-like domain-containing protein n=1 Tax=Tanacetum coccineum TaxID=301880 RepID=A0ABQ5F400_9ASTR